MRSKTTLNLDKEREYDLNLNALIKFEEETGKSLLNMQTGDVFNLKDIRALLWAGLSEFDDITIEESGKLVSMHNMEDVSNQIMEVYEDAMPDNEQGESEGKNKKSSTG
mgnify:CR=1 FL=1